MKKYIAQKPVGRFAKGETVGGLDDHQIKQLLENGVIKEAKEEVEVKTSAAKKPTTGDEKDVKQA